MTALVNIYILIFTIYYQEHRIEKNNRLHCKVFGNIYCNLLTPNSKNLKKTTKKQSNYMQSIKTGGI